MNGPGSSPKHNPAMSPLMLDPESELDPRRPEPRRFVALIVITAAVALALGVTAEAAVDDGRQRYLALVHRLEPARARVVRHRRVPLAGRYPGQGLSVSKSGNAGPEPVKHYYSSKPALLSTLIAGVALSGAAAHGSSARPGRAPGARRAVGPEGGREHPDKVKGVLEKPKDAVKWSAYVYYFKAVLVLLNILPFWIFLILYSRVLDRYAGNDWAWFFSLVAAAMGTYLLPFTQTLNNHTVAAFSAFFALYQFLANLG